MNYKNTSSADNNPTLEETKARLIDLSGPVCSMLDDMYTRVNPNLTQWFSETILPVMVKDKIPLPFVYPSFSYGGAIRLEWNNDTSAEIYYDLNVIGEIAIYGNIHHPSMEEILRLPLPDENSVRWFMEELNKWIGLRDPEELKEDVDFLVKMLRRSACGCVHLDCAVHGAYNPDDIKRYDKVVESDPAPEEARIRREEYVKACNELDRKQ